MEHSWALSTHERRDRIADLVTQNERISVAEIARLFGISEATARRDLEALDSLNLVKRVHGGAIQVGTAPRELPLVARVGEQRAEKRAIARKAAGLVKDGETLLLGSGSSIQLLAEEFRGRKLTVISNSLAVLNILADEKNIDLISLGGAYRADERSFIGHITEQALEEVRADKVFMGIRAIDLEHGLTNDYLPETLTDRAILQAGKQVFVLADHTKLGRIAGAFLAPLGAIEVLITDAQAPEAFISSARELGLTVLVAGE